MTSSSDEAPAPQSRVGRFEIPVAALAAATAFSAVFLVPLVGVLGLPLSAVPAVRLAHRRGLVAGIAACAMTVAIVLGLGWAAGGAGNAIALAFMAAGATALPAATVGFLRAGVDPSRCYLGLCIAGCAFVAATFAIRSLMLAARNWRPSWPPRRSRPKRSAWLATSRRPRGSRRQPS